MNNLAATSSIRRALAFFTEPSVGSATRATLVLRGAVGGVFLVSGATKFLFDNQGAGRFAKIGFPAARELATFVGGTEIVCGALLLVGLAARLAAVPLAIDMVVALATTKVPLLFGVGPEPVAAPPRIGLWAFAYQARLDATMLLACVYIVAVGAGLWSIDALRARRRWEGERYVGWVRHDAACRSLGALDVRPDGGSLLLAEDGALALGVDAVEVTRESTVGSSPQGAPVVVWPAPR